MKNADLNVTAEVLAEIVAGQGITPGGAGKLLPAGRGEGRMTPSGVYRYCVKGVKTDNGRVVKLECAPLGGRLLTSPAAVGRFLAAQAGLVPAASPPGVQEAQEAPPRRRARREAELAAAESTADRLGI